MELRRVGTSGVTTHAIDELGDLLVGRDGVVWLDVPVFDDDAARTLRAAFGMSDDVLTRLAERTLVPRVERVDGHALLVLHSLDEDGHLLEIDFVIGQNFVVTVHGPLTEGVPIDLALRETRRVVEEITGGRAVVTSTADLCAAVVDELASVLEGLLASTASQAGALDRRLREGRTGDAEAFLAELFSVRHGLLTVANRAAQSAQACSSMGVIAPSDKETFDSLQDRFDRLRTLCDGEKEFLQGVLDFYESQVNTKMNIAMARLAVIAAVTLPVTAIGGFFGMNTIVNGETDLAYTLIILVFMAALGGVMLAWAKRQGWW